MAALSQDVLTEEVRVKAAYLHKFAGFVEWPTAAAPPANAPFVIGVAGADPIYRELERIAVGRLVQGRPVEVKRIRSPNAKALGGVHILFIGRELGPETSGFIKASEGLPVLTVAEEPQLLRAVALNFVDRGGNVRFEVSLPVVKLAGLSLSSRLLAVADRVHGAPVVAVDTK